MAIQKVIIASLIFIAAATKDVTGATPIPQPATTAAENDQEIKETGTALSTTTKSPLIEEIKETEITLSTTPTSPLTSGKELFFHMNKGQIGLIVSTDEDGKCHHVQLINFLPMFVQAFIHRCNVKCKKIDGTELVIEIWENEKEGKAYSVVPYTDKLAKELKAKNGSVSNTIGIVEYSLGQLESMCAADEAREARKDREKLPTGTWLVVLIFFIFPATGFCIYVFIPQVKSEGEWMIRAACVIILSVATSVVHQVGQLAISRVRYIRRNEETAV